MKFVLIFALFFLSTLATVVVDSDCSCFDDQGKCIDQTKWVALCNISTYNYAILGAMTASAGALLMLDHIFYKFEKF